MNKLKNYATTVACLVLFLLSSCIKEDLSNCDDDNADAIRVMFVSDNDEPIVPDDLKNIDLFIFDKDDILIGEWKKNTPLLDVAYSLDERLEPGTYYFVAWVNAPSSAYEITPPYSAKELRLREDFALHLNIPADRLIRESLPLLMYGKLDGAVVTEESAGETYVVHLQQITNRLLVTAESPVLGTSRYRISVDDENANYDFEDHLLPCDPFSYIAETADVQRTGKLSALLTLLKLEKTHLFPELKIRNLDSGEDMYKCNLIERILDDVPNNNFETHHDYHIHLVFNEDGTVDVSVTTSITGWDSDKSDNKLDF